MYFRTYRTLPGTTQEKVLVYVFANKYRLVDLHSSDINRNRMTDANGPMVLEISIAIVGIDPPTYIGVDGEVQGFEDSPGHHVDFRSVVHEGFNFDLLVDCCFGVARRTRVERTVDLSRVDRSGSFRK